MTVTRLMHSTKPCLGHHGLSPKHLGKGREGHFERQHSALELADVAINLYF